MDPAEDLLNPAHGVSHNLQKTARGVAGVYAGELRSCGLSRGQFPILQQLEASAGGVAMSALAQRLYMDRTTLTRNLSPLERAELVVREADPGHAPAPVSFTHLTLPTTLTTSLRPAQPTQSLSTGSCQ